MNYAGKNENGKNIYTIPTNIKNNVKIAPFWDVMFALKFQKSGKANEYNYSTFFQKLTNNLENVKGLGDYWERDIEIFARTWEVYLFMKCKEHGIAESFLKKSKLLFTFGLNLNLLVQI